MNAEEIAARELVELLAAVPSEALSITEAKRRLCGETRPISDLHQAMGYAERNGWIRLSRDFLSMSLLCDAA